MRKCACMLKCSGSVSPVRANHQRTRLTDLAGRSSVPSFVVPGYNGEMKQRQTRRLPLSRHTVTLFPCLSCHWTYDHVPAACAAGDDSKHRHFVAAVSLCFYVSLCCRPGSLRRTIFPDFGRQRQHTLPDVITVPSATQLPLLADRWSYSFLATRPGFRKEKVEEEEKERRCERERDDGWEAGARLLCLNLRLTHI